MVKLKGRGDMGSRSTYSDLIEQVSTDQFGEWFDLDGGIVRIKLSWRKKQWHWLTSATMTKY